jgi:hypothetical protein
MVFNLAASSIALAPSCSSLSASLHATFQLEDMNMHLKMLFDEFRVFTNSSNRLLSKLDNDVEWCYKYLI